MNRKNFLRLGGVSLLGLAGRKAVGAFADAAVRPADQAGGALTARRWAMVIDARKCFEEEGCDDCVRACHQVHNVPEFDEQRHEVKWIWKEPFQEAFISEHSPYANEMFHEKPVLVFCNHCDQPPCVRVCPTQATWRREDGLVMMDWHRCIGCRYCMAGCPYGSRSFNWVDPRPQIRQTNTDYPTRAKGVVEKCTFCDERLARGQLPACVEACKHGALVFGDLEDAGSKVRDLLRTNFTIRRKPELGTAPEIYYII
ncbi:MAG: sulfate reduction electron transfer complex DsrMKJOP subunit DsrO [Acidobacteriota bacterium]